MPAGYVVDAENLRTVLKELRGLEDNSIKELRAEFKEKGKPILNDLATAIPVTSPLSGFAGRNAQSPYRWTKPSGTIKTPLARGGRRPGRYRSIASFVFTNRRPNAGLDILELAGSAGVGKNKKGMTYRGQNLVRGLQTAGYGVKGGLGRFVIPKFRDVQPDATRITKEILSKFTAKVNRRLR